MQLNIKKTNSAIPKRVEDLNRPFSKEDIHTANRHTERGSTSLIIREMQIKATVRHHLTLVRTVIIKTSTSNESWKGCGERGPLLRYWWECQLIRPLRRVAQRFLNNLKTELLYEPATPLLGKHLEKTKIQEIHAALCAQQHYAQELRHRDAQMPTSTWTGEGSAAQRARNVTLQ